MKCTLVVRLKGGLGNQLFCYATARRLAHKNNADLVLDHLTGFRHDHRYRRSFGLRGFSIPARLATPAEMFEPLPRISRFLLRKWSSVRPWGKQRYVEQRGVEFDERLLDLKLQPGTTWFDGFGQSERYFDDVQEIVRSDLRIALPIEAGNLEMGDRIASTLSVCLHLRWFDSANPGNPVNMPVLYYERAIQRLAKDAHGAHFFVFSDDASRAAERLAPVLRGHPHTYVDQNGQMDPIHDFWLMTQCRHFIISNSTFGWWAAWLGEKSDGMTKVIAPLDYVDPRHTVTAWGFPHLIPNRWIVV